MKYSIQSLATFAAAVLLWNPASAQTPPAAAGTTTNAVTAPGNRGFRGFNAPVDRPAPRSDRNSQIAHEQLVEKAKKGGIDVYFEELEKLRRENGKED